VTRSEPGQEITDERALLEGWLDYYRATLLHKCAGLSPEQLVTRSCPPSPMTLVGLVRHLTEMERMYAQRLVEPDIQLYYCTDDSPDGDFVDIDATDTQTDLDTFAEHCARSRELLAGLPFDARLRWFLLYLGKEYARHLGHADLLRERIDGVTGE
jgi:hypothetical protein